MFIINANELVSHVADDDIMTNGIADYVISKENEAMSQLSQVVDCIADDTKQLTEEKYIAIDYNAELCYVKGTDMVNAAREGLDEIKVYGRQQEFKGYVAYAALMEKIGEAHMNALIYAECLRWLAYSKYKDATAAYADIKARVELQVGDLTDQGRSYLAQCSEIACNTHMSFKMKCLQLLELIGYNAEEDTIDFTNPNINEYGFTTPITAFFILSWRAGGSVFSLIWDGIINVLHGLRYVIDKALGGLVTELSKGLLSWLGFTDAYAVVDDYVDEAFSDFHCDFKISSDVGLPDITDVQTQYPTIHDKLFSISNIGSSELYYHAIEIYENIYGELYTIDRNIVQVCLGILHHFDPYEVLVDIEYSEEHEGHIYYRYRNIHNLSLSDILNYTVAVHSKGRKIYFDSSVVTEHLSKTHYVKVALPCGLMYLWTDDNNNICCSLYTIPTTVSPITANLKTEQTWIPYLDQFLVQGHGDFELDDGDCIKNLGYAWMWNCLFLVALFAPNNYSDADIRMDAAVLFNSLHIGVNGNHARFVAGWQNDHLKLTVYTTSGSVAYEDVYDDDTLLDQAITPLDIADMLSGRLDGGYFTFSRDDASQSYGPARWVIPCLTCYFGLMFNDEYFYPYVHTSSLPYGKYKVLNMKDQLKQVMVIPIVVAVAVTAVKIFKKIRAIKASLWERQAILDTALFNATDASHGPINYEDLSVMYKEQKRISLISTLLGAFIGSTKTAIMFLPNMIGKIASNTVNGVRNLLHGSNSDSDVIIDDITNLDDSEKLNLVIRLIRGY